MKRLSRTLSALFLALTIIVGTGAFAFAATSQYGGYDPEEDAYVNPSYAPANMSGPATGISVTKSGGKWVALRNGQIATDYTGIAKNQYGWWRVTDGYVDFDYTGVAQNEYGWWRVLNGKVDFTANSIYENEYGWWKTFGGKVDFKANGIWKNENGWWKVTKGKVDFFANGVYKNEYGWWYVRGGRVDFSFTGIAGNEYGYWYVVNGKVDFSKNGLVNYNGIDWTVTGGKAVGPIPKAVKTKFEANGCNSASYANSHNYCIAVNRKQSVVVVYGKDQDGKFTRPVKSFVCSCGLPNTPTPIGSYKTSDKYVWRALDGGVYGQYATRITGHILFHSVPYYQQDKGTLEAEEYNKLGTPASAGCVRLTVRDAKWIYDNCSSGTIVTIYADGNIREPLIKPTPVKLDLNDKRSYWDPTDPDANNPWK